MLSQLPSVSTLHAASAWGSWALMIYGLFYAESMPAGKLQEMQQLSRNLFLLLPIHELLEAGAVDILYLAAPLRISTLHCICSPAVATKRVWDIHRSLPRRQQRPGSHSSIQHILWYKQNSSRMQYYSSRNSLPVLSEKTSGSFVLKIGRPAKAASSTRQGFASKRRFQDRRASPSILSASIRSLDSTHYEAARTFQRSSTRLELEAARITKQHALLHEAARTIMELEAARITKQHAPLHEAARTNGTNDRPGSSAACFTLSWSQCLACSTMAPALPERGY